MWRLAKTSEHFPKFFFIAVEREFFFFLKAHSFGKLTLKSAFTFYDIVRSYHQVNSTCKVGRNLHFNCHSLEAESPHNYVSNKGLEVMQDSNHKIIIPSIYTELYLQTIFTHCLIWYSSSLGEAAAPQPTEERTEVQRGGGPGNFHNH